LPTGQVDIIDNMIGQAIEEDMNSVVCMP